MERADGLVVAELLVVLADAHVVAGAGESPGEVWLGGPGLPRVVHVAPAPTPGQLRDLLLGASRAGVVVADRLPARQRRLLDDAGWGWWDRRGALSVQVGDRHLRREPVPVPVPEVSLPAPLERPSGRRVALQLLEDPGRVPPVRVLAATVGTSTGAAGRVVAELRELGLVSGRSVVDPRALLLAVAAGWRPRWHAVAAGLPPAATPQRRHVLGLDGRAGGWRRVGVPAALALGAPTPTRVSGDPQDGRDEQPEHVLLPDERALAWLLRPADRSGADSAPAAGDQQVLVAVAPRPRSDAGVDLGAGVGVELPVAPALEVALSLAADRTGGGPRLLDAWRDASWPLAW